MVSRTAAGTHTPSAYAFHKPFGRNCNVYHHVNVRNAVKGFRLRNCPREPVEQEPVCAVLLLYALRDHRHDKLVRNKLAPIYIAFGFRPQRRAFTHLGAEHIPCGDMGYTIKLADLLSLGAFAGARRSKKYKLHSV